MNVNICHLQVSHSQTLIQPRTGCGKGGGGGGQMERREEEGLWRVKVKPLEGGLTERYTAALKSSESGLIALESE